MNSMKKILIMGLPGSGKTTLAKELKKRIEVLGKTVQWLNADIVREKFNDWDFSEEGRIRQSTRMKVMAEESQTDFVICDFVAPIPQMRDIFDADWTIWMDTIKEGRFEDTNKLFVPPKIYDFKIEEQDCKRWAKTIILELGIKKGDNQVRSLIKAITWRITGTIDTFIISWFITGQILLASGIALTEIMTKICLFWSHERIWNRISWGKN
jgi:adenylylsulfate kinase